MSVLHHSVKFNHTIYFHAVTYVLNNTLLKDERPAAYVCSGSVQRNQSQLQLANVCLPERHPHTDITVHFQATAEDITI